MSYQIMNYVDAVTRSVGHLHREHWIAISVVVLVLGLICMRGFGSRNNY
jgi:hypothetical protein